MYSSRYNEFKPIQLCSRKNTLSCTAKLKLTYTNFTPPFAVLRFSSTASQCLPSNGKNLKRSFQTLFVKMNSGRAKCSPSQVHVTQSQSRTFLYKNLHVKIQFSLDANILKTVLQNCCTKQSFQNFGKYCDQRTTSGHSHSSYFNPL